MSLKFFHTWSQRGFDIGRVQSCALRLPKYWPPTRRVCPPSATKAGGTHSPGGEGGGGSIFWKTQDIWLASYSNNLSTHGPVSFCYLDDHGGRGEGRSEGGGVLPALWEGRRPASRYQEDAGTCLRQKSVSFQNHLALKIFLIFTNGGGWLSSTKADAYKNGGRFE